MMVTNYNLQVQRILHQTGRLFIFFSTCSTFTFIRYALHNHPINNGPVSQKQFQKQSANILSHIRLLIVSHIFSHTIGQYPLPFVTRVSRYLKISKSQMVSRRSRPRSDKLFQAQSASILQPFPHTIGQYLAYRQMHNL